MWIDLAERWDQRTGGKGNASRFRWLTIKESEFGFSFNLSSCVVVVVN
jgi:hypothetical protein